MTRARCCCTAAREDFGVAISKKLLLPAGRTNVVLVSQPAIWRIHFAWKARTTKGILATNVTLLYKGGVGVAISKRTKKLLLPSRSDKCCACQSTGHLANTLCMEVANDERNLCHECNAAVQRKRWRSNLQKPQKAAPC